MNNNELDQITNEQRKKEYQDILNHLMGKGISARNAKRMVANKSKQNLKKFMKNAFRTRNDVKPHIELTPEELIEIHGEEVIDKNEVV
jgi:uncharacterized protein YoaH (UPF0181 family)